MAKNQPVHIRQYVVVASVKSIHNFPDATGNRFQMEKKKTPRSCGRLNARSLVWAKNHKGVKGGYSLQVLLY
jgi:hypothetical protein